MPPALVFAALGLALAFAPRRAWAPGLAIAVATAFVSSLVPAPAGWREAVFLGCWASVAASAAAVHLPGGLSPRQALALSLNAGLWAGAVVAIGGARPDLLKAAPCLLLLLPAALVVGRRAPIVVKVASSWLIAIALLAAALPFLPVTPGYLPDHLD